MKKGFSEAFARIFVYSYTSVIFLVVLNILSILCTSSAMQAQVSKQLFSMSMQSGVLYGQAWPNPSLGGVRLWNTQTSWPDISPTSSRYDWSSLDAWLRAAHAHGTDVVYTFGRIPKWASSKPGDNTCRYGPGQCDPPNDLNRDGSGTNQHFRNFVTAIATHAAGRIKYWEIANEPQNSFYWTGTIAQVVRMAKDARSIILSIDPNAVLLSPGTGLRLNAVDWTAAYLAAGGGQYADVIAFHGYVEGSCPSTLPDTSLIIPRVSVFRTMLAKHGQSTKPLWNTEASWGHTSDTCFGNADLQAGFVAQMYLLYQTARTQRLYWYAWNASNTGALWNNKILKPGLAYQQVYKWLVGATISSPCAMGSDSTWKCVITKPGGYQAEIVWNAKTSKLFIAPSQYQHYVDVYANIFKLPVNGAVQIGFKPILLQP